jgi:hypothetical protein
LIGCSHALSRQYRAIASRNATSPESFATSTIGAVRIACFAAARSVAASRARARAARRSTARLSEATFARASFVVYADSRAGEILFTIRPVDVEQGKQKARTSSPRIRDGPSLPEVHFGQIHNIRRPARRRGGSFPAA